MTKINDGGPAFPHHEVFGGESYKVQGMTLRDYAAIHAPKPCGGEMAILQEAIYNTGKPWPSDAEAEAILRYRFADAMIAAREAPND